MSTLQVSNVHFESTGNNRIEYSGSNTFNMYAGGINVFTANSSSIDFQNLSSITVSSFKVTGNVTPTVIAANTNDWNPGITEIYQVRISANTDGNINYILLV